ncbi:hypothetical protein ZIOFF_021960 [Zingiber officinale]|uniref:Uncharacterized protein n=1 Tax=Zingiber officinale TaxID=94328 RepID=A0A8J5HJG0_ZINOF|nr:hypothetical protein ZIOFF_021960 [Zingiber officinale]
MEGPATASFHCSTVVVAYAYARGNVETPFPAAYFSNCLNGCLVESEISNLTGKDGVATITKAIGEAIMAFKEGPFKALTEELPKRWERLSKVEITPIDKTGATAVAESKEEEGTEEMPEEAAPMEELSVDVDIVSYSSNQ